MIYIGVDPGKKGAIAIIWDDLKPRAYPMPLSEGGIDVGAIVKLMRGILGPFGPFGRETFVTVEKLQPMPLRDSRGKQLGGHVANYNRGVSMGWHWMLTALGIDHEMVPHQTWQATMLAGAPGLNSKQKSINVAQLRFPGVSLLRTTRSRKPDDGISDALLIADYGRITRNEKDKAARQSE